MASQPYRGREFQETNNREVLIVWWVDCHDFKCQENINTFIKIFTWTSPLCCTVLSFELKPAVIIEPACGISQDGKCNSDRGEKQQEPS
jgi:hypothetical protein